MEVHVRIASTYTLCRPVGSLDASTAALLRQAMAQMSCASHLVLDLSDVPFIDSAALGALVNGVRRVREGGGEVAVSSSRRHITHVLQTIGFDRVVPLVGSVEEARRIVCGGPAALADVA